MGKLLGICVATAICCAAADPSFDEVKKAIRANDLVQLRQMIQSDAAANVADGLKTTPLHYAALYGSVEGLNVLLSHAPDPNARNQGGATPLILAAWNFERTRLLVEHGASVNAVTKHGITALLVAAAAHGNAATVRYLLDKGADIKAVTEDGEDALLRASFSGDADTVQLLIERGADAKHTDKAGDTPLMNATVSPNATRIGLLLKAGADPNALNTFAGMVKNGPIALTHMSALMMAAPNSDQETVALLLKAGARVNEKDCRDMTALMLAIASDQAQPGTVRQLLAAGADVQATDKYGASVLDWARRFGNPEIVTMLTAAGARGHDVAPTPIPPVRAETGDAKESVARALALFTKSDFFRAGGGCSGCHHQPAHARAAVEAQNANLSTDQTCRKAFLDSVAAIRPRIAGILPYLSTFGGDADVLFSIMAANADLNVPSNEFSDMMLHFIAARQDPSGAWISLGFARPPLESSTISRTAYGIKILKRYAWAARQQEFDKRIQAAQLWLRQATPVTTYEHADRILGLHEAGVSDRDLKADVERLMKLQREDGGWAQTEYLSSDAFATGLVLETLLRAGLVRSTDAAYQRGVAFLLRTQFPDGSWYVRSRAPKFQPYFQSGLPFDHDQWISSAGAAWAVMALSHAVPAPAMALR